MMTPEFSRRVAKISRRPSVLALRDKPGGYMAFARRLEEARTFDRLSREDRALIEAAEKEEDAA